MEKIITEIAGKFINNLLEIISSGESFAQIEPVIHHEAKNCAAQVLSAYAESVDHAIVADRAARKKAGYSVERRGDERRVQTLVGEICFSRTYFKKASGGYEYLADTALGVGKRGRVSEGLSLSLVRAAKDMSYGKASLHIASGEISRQTVMGKVRQSHAPENSPKKRRRVPELHIDADEDHVTLLGGKKSEVPLISVYEGIESREALAVEDIEFFNQLTASLCDDLPERTEKVLSNAQYLKNFVSGISVCEKDPSANNGGCTEPHVSHVLSARLSSRPMAWSRRTLKKLAPVLAAGSVTFQAKQEKPELPQPLRKAAASARKALCRGAAGLPAADSIGILRLGGKITGMQKILKALA